MESELDRMERAVQRDLCSSCPNYPSGSYDCAYCRYNFVILDLPKQRERFKDEYWQEIARINRIGITEPGWQFRTVDYDTSTSEGLIKSEISSACVEMMSIFNLYYEEFQRKCGFYYVAVVWDTLLDIFAHSDYVTLYQPVIVDDSDFDEDLPF